MATIMEEQPRLQRRGRHPEQLRRGEGGPDSDIDLMVPGNIGSESIA